MKLDSNKTVSEFMHYHSVMVNGGSGVLVNAMTLNYSYVLTAAHVIFEKVDDNVVIDSKGNKLRVLEVFPHPKYKDEEVASFDCAILKVVYQVLVPQRCFPASSLPHRADLILVGYPATERASLDSVKHYDGHMTSVVKELIIFTVDGVPGKGTIEGMSGGAVYHVQNEIPYLIGVEFKMDGTGQDQQFGRVQCHSLVRFQEIIIAYESAQMIPAHLECFSRLSDAIFGFNVIEQSNVRNLKVELCKFADGLIERGLPPPYKIMQKYNLELLIDSERPSEMESKELWVAYFEFLVVCTLLDNVGIADDKYIHDVGRRRRLLYTSNETNWISRLDVILKAARNLLDKDGTVIVASPESAAKLLPPDFLLKKVINDISIVPAQGPFSIDKVESSIYKSFKLTHLEGLRTSCVVDKEWEYPLVSAGLPQLCLFRDKLDEFIK